MTQKEAFTRLWYSQRCAYDKRVGYGYGSGYGIWVWDTAMASMQRCKLLGASAGFGKLRYIRNRRFPGRLINTCLFKFLAKNILNGRGIIEIMPILWSQ